MTAASQTADVLTRDCQLTSSNMQRDNGRKQDTQRYQQ